jgi:hypothetical protein
MEHRARVLHLALVAVLLLAAPLARASSWDESGAQGDLSNNRLAPSSLDLTPGDNTVSGSVIAGDVDYLTIVVPAGFTLSQINLVSFTSVDDLAFIGIQAGSTFTQPPTGTDVTQLLGWAHFGPTAPVPYFDIIGTGTGAIGFSAPLPAGPYTLWIQQTSAQTVGYGWDFVVTGGSVPEPGSAALTLLGVGALLGRVANRFLGRAQ